MKTSQDLDLKVVFDLKLTFSKICQALFSEFYLSRRHRMASADGPGSPVLSMLGPTTGMLASVRSLVWTGMGVTRVSKRMSRG